MKTYGSGFKKDNKGLSLIELLVAMALLAILIVPIFNSFIASARINLKSRQLMAATDLAQTIFEGFSDKSYGTVKDDIDGVMGHGTLSGNHAYATVSNNYYNMPEHYVALDGSLLTSLGSPSVNCVTYGSDIYVARELISGNNAAGMTTVSINSLICDDAREDLSVSTNSCLRGWLDDSKNMAALVYTGVDQDGFLFDVVVTFLPMAETETKEHFPYCVTVTVYDAKENPDIERMSSERYQFSMKGGISN